jgi:predicted MFS family arabinose efflux permease
MRRALSPSPGAGLRHGWAVAAVSLSLAAAVSLGMARAAPAAAAVRRAVRWRDFAWGLAGYTMFGLGYIGYMTFVVTLLREQGWSAASVSAFFAVLGLGVIASSWLWAGLLQRHRDGRPLALLNGLLALATVLPAWSAAAPLVFASGLLFGAVFLSVVASTTALVRHNATPDAWPSGIAAFTIVFALGQIIGPGAVGAIADGAGSLLRGFVVSAVALGLGALMALWQRALPEAPGR